MFHPDYKHITDKLPDSLIRKAYQGLLNHSKNPVPFKMISGKSDQIESYLRHKLEVYENSLNRKWHNKSNMTQKKILRSQSWPECDVFLTLPVVHVIDNGVQTDSNTWPEALKHDHEEENNHQVMNELKVLSQYLVDYNKRTFEKFM